ncbi:tRNA (adenosine(37)-N6)-threonylcarbamoyltransferase complex ATPase subunit type 1 TsaE [Niabella digestorum]|jgi:ATPase, YjeE family|uniref:tRNA threonylcarbamoyladenosine biosynthesis protein TsaE n=1 Tax=Niabella digestorum TaxID=3117701 RepID=A0ABU7RD91_9BACT
MSFITKEYSIQDIDSVAKWFWNQVKDHKVIALHGNMGAGKTTLVSAVCKLLGVQDAVSSPTFSIINEYMYSHNEAQDVIFHIDLYRLKDEEEAIQAGVEDCLYSGNYCFVEWPERIPDLLPPDAIHVYLHQDEGNTRTIEITQ